jgi:ABC-type dipeptide/oligopeptide/nickel transport system ATPase subunit
LLITGRSGAGKSTLTAQLAMMGYPLLADDVTAIAVDADGAPVALPGLPAMRLWKDALQRLDAQADAQRAVREGLEKYYLPAHKHCDQPQPICGIVRLSTKAHGPVDIADLERATALSWISHHVHRKHFLPGMGLQRFAFERAGALVQHVPIIEIKRPHDGVSPEEMATTIIDHFRCALPMGQS